MLDDCPSESTIKKLLGREAYAVWQELNDFIRQNYNIDIQWDDGRKAGLYECKFRKGGKTLCCLYVREESFGFMVIYGKSERAKFEAERQAFSAEINLIYDETKTYHDGKWIMINVTDNEHLTELKTMMLIKKKPNKK